MRVRDNAQKYDNQCVMKAARLLRRREGYFRVRA